jgi:hypothetical protein
MVDRSKSSHIFLSLVTALHSRIHQLTRTFFFVQGVGRLRGLDFVYLSYDSQQVVTCRQICDANATAHSPNSVQWRALPAKFTPAEQRLYESRGHIAPSSDDLDGDTFSDAAEFVMGGGPPEVPPEVVGLLSLVRPDCIQPGGLAQRGRLWQYAPGEFGWGSVSGAAEWVVDYRRMVEGGTILDVTNAAQ